jgi:serine/threonine protein kinase
MAPEILFDDYAWQYDYSNDVYSFGVVIFRLVEGRFPYDVENTSDGIPEFLKILRDTQYTYTLCYPELRPLLDAMLTKDPKCRITVEEVLTHPFVNVNLELPD